MTSRPVLRVMVLLVAALPLAAAVLLFGSASAEAATFGPNLETATPDYQHNCDFVLGAEGCTIRDPIEDDMELVLPDPVTHGNQTGVVTAIHVKAAVEAPAQFIVVGWTGSPKETGAIPTAVTAVSEQVMLKPGINNFNTNLPVDRVLTSSGYEDWSQISLSILNGTSPIPAEEGGFPGSLGFMLLNGQPLTHTVEDLTAPPNIDNEGGLAPGTLLMSGEVEITTSSPAPAPAPGPAPTPTPAPPLTPAPPAPDLAIPRVVRIKHNAVAIPLHCVGPASCAGTLRIQSLAAHVARAARKRKRRRRHTRRITYASGSFSMIAGTTKRVRVELSKAGKRAVRHRRVVKAYANLAFSDGHVSSAKITLRRRR